MKNLKKLVIQEAENLKQSATSEELARLDFTKLYGGDPRYCVYGQVAGGCFNERATMLLNNCAKPFSSFISFFQDANHEYFYDDGSRCFSPLEFYILQANAKNETLIAFLKSERETLTTDDL